MTDKSERNIKFRVWSKLHKKWYTNTILIAYDGLSFAHFVKVDNDGKAVEHQVFNAENLDLVVQQSTGLTDQNGQEIYEGDILSFPKDSMEDYIVHAIVKYGTGEFDGGTYKYPGFYLESTGDDVNLKEGDIMEPYEITNLHDPNWYHYEVVGNIFEGVDK